MHMILIIYSVSYYCTKISKFVRAAAGTRTSLEALRRRLQHTNHFVASRPDSDVSTSPLLIVDAELAIPRVVTQPSLDDAQAAVSRAVQTIMAISEQVTPWQHFNRLQMLQQKVSRHRLVVDDSRVINLFN